VKPACCRKICQRRTSGFAESSDPSCPLCLTALVFPITRSRAISRSCGHPCPPMYTQFHPRSPKTTQESAEGRNHGTPPPGCQLRFQKTYMAASQDIPDWPRFQRSGVKWRRVCAVLFWPFASCQVLAAQFSKTPPAQADPRWEDSVTIYHLFAFVVKKKMALAPVKQKSAGAACAAIPLDSPAPAGRTSLAQVRKPWENFEPTTRAP
jgi:hypothetical protein